MATTEAPRSGRVALIEAGSPGLNIYSHVAMGRGIPLLATVLRDAGHDAKAFIEDISGEGSVDWDFVAGADVVGFSAITCTVPRTQRLLEQARAINPQAKIVFGGPEPTCEPERSILVGADYVLRGEAEITLPRLVVALLGQDGESLEAIPGLVWREEDRLRKGPPPQQLSREELDALPFVDRSLVHQAHRISVAAVWRSRGCTRRCDFCEVCEIWPRYVVRQDGSSVGEMVRAWDEGFRTTFLIDDNAAANKPSFKQFLRSVSEKGFSRMLVVQMHASAALTSEGRLDRELLRLLKKVAGVTVVCVGVESADDANLDQLHKLIDSSRMSRALRAMRRYGLVVHGMFIALPSDTREIIRRNCDYAKKCVTSLQYLFETPLPGTKRTREHLKTNRMLFSRIEDLALFDGMHVVLKPDRMTPQEMQRFVTKEYRRFYSIWRVALSALRGTFFRHRLLGKGQRAYLAELAFPKRLFEWVRIHAEYKYAPTSFLAIGRKRIRAFMRDPAYLSFLDRLRFPCSS